MVEQVGRFSRLQKLKVWIIPPGATEISLRSLSARLFNACPTLSVTDVFVAKINSPTFEGLRFMRSQGGLSLPLSDTDEDEWRKW